MDLLVLIPESGRAKIHQLVKSVLSAVRSMADKSRFQGGRQKLASTVTMSALEDV
jgi:hypothetical protein